MLSGLYLDTLLFSRNGKVNMTSEQDSGGGVPGLKALDPSLSDIQSRWLFHKAQPEERNLESFRDGF